MGASVSTSMFYSHSEIGKLVPLCDEKRQDVVQCYHGNSDRTLMCSDIVNEYVQCVKNARKVSV